MINCLKILFNIDTGQVTRIASCTVKFYVYSNHSLLHTGPQGKNNKYMQLTTKLIIEERRWENLCYYKTTSTSKFNKYTNFLVNFSPLFSHYCSTFT